MSDVVTRFLWGVFLFLLMPLILLVFARLQLPDIYLLLGSLVRLVVQAVFLFFLGRLLFCKIFPRLKGWQITLISVCGSLTAFVLLSEVLEYYLGRGGFREVCGGFSPVYEYGCRLMLLDVSVLFCFLVFFAFSFWLGSLLARNSTE